MSVSRVSVSCVSVSHVSITCVSIMCVSIMCVSVTCVTAIVSIAYVSQQSLSYVSCHSRQYHICHNRQYILSLAISDICITAIRIVCAHLSFAPSKLYPNFQSGLPIYSSHTIPLHSHTPPALADHHPDVCLLCDLAWTECAAESCDGCVSSAIMGMPPIKSRHAPS